MSPNTNLTPMVAAPRGRNERLELATRLFREFHTPCSRHSRRDLVITEDLIPFVVKGLRWYGGRRGFILAGKPGRGRRPARPPSENLRNAANPFLEGGRPHPRQAPEPR
jgi:hypothetical protein